MILFCNKILLLTFVIIIIAVYNNYLITIIFKYSNTITNNSIYRTT